MLLHEAPHVVAEEIAHTITTGVRDLTARAEITTPAGILAVAQ
jgi:hypothetical protein